MKKKDIKNNSLFIIVIGILVVVVLILSYLLFSKNNQNNITLNNTTTDLSISETQSEITDITNKEQAETEYTNFIGYGELLIDSENPNVYLQNPEDNTVFMQFDVKYKDEIIYTSDLIAPGKQDIVNVFDICEAGKHKLNYIITTYDVNTKELCMAGINQEQEINVVK